MPFEYAIPSRYSLFMRFRPGIAALALLAIAPPLRAGIPRPDVLIVTVDTLRRDRVGAYGYARDVTPVVDRLLASGVRFADARTPEPLTAPSLTSMLTSLHPQDHGVARNGLRARSDLVSLPKLLHRAGYETVAFVGNWTLRDRLTGLGSHFDLYREVLTRHRWFGLVRSEATAEDLTDAATSWLAERGPGGKPLFLWVHYVDPHAPYRYHAEYAERLGIRSRGEPPKADRYDTEIAETDHAIGRLLDAFAKARAGDPPLVVFASDHGESLGDHGTWGHGRDLFDVCLRMPMGLAWKGHVAPGTIEPPSSILDVAPTVLTLLGLPVPKGMAGFDWKPVLDGAAAPVDRATYYQAHRGAVIAKHASERARRAGLLEVGWIRAGRKETIRIDNGRVRAFDLSADPGETHDLATRGTKASKELAAWTRRVLDGLAASDAEAVEPLDPEAEERLRSLGYVQ